VSRSASVQGSDVHTPASLAGEELNYPELAPGYLTSESSAGPSRHGGDPVRNGDRNYMSFYRQEDRGYDSDRNEPVEERLHFSEAENIASGIMAANFDDNDSFVSSDHDADEGNTGHRRRESLDNNARSYPSLLADAALPTVRLYQHGFNRRPDHSRPKDSTRDDTVSSDRSLGLGPQSHESEMRSSMSGSSGGEQDTADFEKLEETVNQGSSISSSEVHPMPNIKLKHDNNSAVLSTTDRNVTKLLDSKKSTRTGSTPSSRGSSRGPQSQFAGDVKGRRASSSTGQRSRQSQKSNSANSQRILKPLDGGSQEPADDTSQLLVQTREALAGLLPGE